MSLPSRHSAIASAVSAPERDTTRFLPSSRRTLSAVALAAAVPFVTLLALVSGGWWPLLSFEAAVAERLYGWVRPEPGLAHGLHLWTEVSGTWSMRIVSLLAAAWLMLRRCFLAALWAGTAVFTANLLGLLGKLGVDRPRPEFPEPLAAGVGPSFPSGHALMAVTGMGIVLLATLPLLRGAWRRAAWVAAAVVALSTSLSRPLLGVHWVSDIVAGMCLGVCVLALTMLAWTFLPPALHRWDRPVRRWGHAPDRGDHGSRRTIPDVGH